ncbi:hypothetical protein BE15_20290 [Sorangium cellulosum]|uniref:Uncharacterized protein n=1 Tax=Sorangium cellulosum TaxID=56 RepID=A0A150QMH8_SORCE|nr:hypothetical protein BE15_20290 [Sorangium cellulosum]
MVEDAVARSDILEEAGDLDGAISVLSGAIRIVPDEPWLLARRGRLFRIREEWRKAIADFDVALAIKPDAPTTLFLRGTCRAELGEFEDAIADLESCIRLQSTAADAYWHLGTIYSFRGDIARTIAAYRKALELDPDKYPGLKDELIELDRKLEESNRHD